MVKKIIATILILISLFNPMAFADDKIEDEELIDLNEVMEASVTVSQEEPTINSRAAVVIDRSTGVVLYGKNENTRKKMASTTKIMTAIVVIENADLNKTVEVSKRAAGTGGSRLRIIYRGENNNKRFIIWAYAVFRK